MSTILRCDGCSRELRGPHGPSEIVERVITGRRANDMRGGYPLPAGEFDWCESCARIAFTAVRRSQEGL